MHLIYYEEKHVYSPNPFSYNPNLLILSELWRINESYQELSPLSTKLIESQQACTMRKSYLMLLP